MNNWFTDRWDLAWALEEAAFEQETINSRLIAKSLIPGQHALVGFSPAPMLPTNLSIRTAR